MIFPRTYSSKCGFTLFWYIMPSATSVSAGSGGVYQRLIDGQLRTPVVLAGLVDEPDQLLPQFLPLWRR